MEDEEQRQQLEDDLVGYRFHPSDEEIVSYYLANKLRYPDFFFHVINEVDINEFEPWDLRDFAAIQSDDSEWYFFTEPNYMDANRTKIIRKTKAGFWKVTCKDRQVKDKRGRVIGCKRTVVFHLGRHPGVRTHWKIHEFHYKDANRLYQRPFVLCRLKKKADDGDEQSPPQLAYNSGKFHNVNIVPKENHEVPLELQSLFNDDEPDYDPLLEAQQFLMNTDQGPSSSNGFINEFDASRSQLDTREKDDEFVNSIWASDDDQHLHEENVQTRLHDFKPVKPLSGYVAASSNLRVAQSGSSRGSKVLQADFKPEVPKPAEKPHVAVVPLQSDSSDSTIETTHEQQGKVLKTPRLVGGCTYTISKQLQSGYDESYKKPWDKPKPPEKPKEPKMPLSRKGSYIYLETPAWSHKQYPPSVYIANIVVALFLLLFIVREMVSLH
ncbi:hypothetical protein Ddye_017398 [Dipteronia dyeriana]|uniref:NAC domain-containing protein n=1 Tax=Dipteronia dyeriana TaxID=168575 RepID=A0AAD9U9H3_9ROSI|nr:hypothetical protein Ddye_017398 [Dipteronia dyeriana]